MNKRIEWIDSLRGMAIILVVWGHWNIPVIGEKFIYSFHMPLFFFLSGYLFNHKGLSLKDFAMKKTKGYLIPYAIYAVIAVPFSPIFDPNFSITNIVLNFFFINGKVGWNAPIWFLLVMFMMEVLSYFLLSEIALSYSIIGSLVLAGIMSLFPMSMPFGINIVVLALFFYQLGILSKKNGWIERTNFITLIIGVFGAIVFGVVLNSRVSVYNFELGNYFYFLIASISGILMMFTAFSKIGNIKVLNFYGKNTLVLFASHYFFLMSVMWVSQKFLNFNIYLNKSWLLSIILLILTLAVYAIVIKFVNKYLPILNGNQNEIVKKNKLITK